VAATLSKATEWLLHAGWEPSTAVLANLQVLLGGGYSLIGLLVGPVDLNI